MTFSKRRTSAISRSVVTARSAATRASFHVPNRSATVDGWYRPSFEYSLKETALVPARSATRRMSDISSASETGARTRSSWNLVSVDILESYIIGRWASAIAVILAKLGRQGKRLAGWWSDVSEEIGIFGLPPDTLCWLFWPKAQRYQCAERHPPLQRLLVLPFVPMSGT